MQNGVQSKMLSVWGFCDSFYLFSKQLIHLKTIHFNVLRPHLRSVYLLYLRIKKKYNIHIFHAFHAYLKI